MNLTKVNDTLDDSIQALSIGIALKHIGNNTRAFTGHWRSKDFYLIARHRRGYIIFNNAKIFCPDFGISCEYEDPNLIKKLEEAIDMMTEAYEPQIFEPLDCGFTVVIEPQIIESELCGSIIIVQPQTAA